MMVVRTSTELRARLGGTAASVAFVPTMGALHQGHLSLFSLARRHADLVVASIFVNPTQFNDPADLARYPRPEHEDTQLAERARVDLLYMPAVDDLYPAGFATTVTVRGAALGFEGDHRPGHFDGVATVCAKLFAIVNPHVAVFGQKDAQQVAVVKQVVRDLSFPLQVVVGPTLRDADGLALSSRNQRLSSEERGRALAIPAALQAGLRAFQAGQDPVAAARPVLVDLDVEYVGVADWSQDPTLVIAARAGATRLIDNVPLNDPARAGLESRSSE